MAYSIGTGFPQFPCALVQMRYSIEENSCCHFLKGGKTSGGKTPKERRKREERGGGCVKRHYPYRWNHE